MIKVLVRLISRANKNESTEGVPIDKWTPEQMSAECKREIIAQQNYLDKMDAASLIYMMFMDSTI